MLTYADVCSSTGIPGCAAAAVDRGRCGTVGSDEVRGGRDFIIGIRPHTARWLQLEYLLYTCWETHTHTGYAALSQDMCTFSRRHVSLQYMRP